MVSPLVLGTGKHLFQNGTGPVGLALTEQQSFGNGVTYHVYTSASAAAAA